MSSKRRSPTSLSYLSSGSIAFSRRSLITICPGKLETRETWKKKSQTWRSFGKTSQDILENELNVYSRKKQSNVTIKALLETGKGVRLQDFTPNSNAMEPHQRVQIQVASFLHRELPIRFAHRIVELLSLPIMRESKFVGEVVSWYKQSFQEMRKIAAPSDPEKEAAFHQVMERIFLRHGHTLITMAKASHELRRMLGQDTHTFAEQLEVQNGLDKFYLSRIGIRTLSGHYLALKNDFKEGLNPNRPIVGMIHQAASPYEIAKNAINDATYMCTRTHGDAPLVTIHGRLDLTFPTIPEYVHYILFELLKNSMRATVEFHGVDNDLPPIKIVIADGEENEDVVIKVSDEGGGIRRSDMKKIWSYLFTTAHSNDLDNFVMNDEIDSVSDFNRSTPLAGLGYGLPISRNYARHLGGDLHVMSMEGYGTDSFVYLARI